MSFFRLPLALMVVGLPVFGGSVSGIKNFDQVDMHVYRGAQPSEEGFAYLSKLGVKTVIDLREADERGRWEEKAVTAAGMKYVNVPMTGMTPPTEQEITKILAILEDTSGGPVFVHCMRGADRTGAVIAAYHIDHDAWDNSRALKDAKSHSMSPFQSSRMAYIRSFRARTLAAQAGSTSAPAVTTPVEATDTAVSATAVNASISGAAN